MRAPLSWIREFTPVKKTPEEIADALNQLGLEVEAIDEPGRDINGVIIARILDVVPHPDADRIRLADIDFGDGRQLRVVCGAPNIEAGMVVPFAQVGAVLPGDFKIEKRKIRGVVSEGMLCSARELGLGDDHGGILDAARRRTELGADVREVLGLNDVVFDLAITPNRPDAMGVVGVARELVGALRSAVRRRRSTSALRSSKSSTVRAVVVEAIDRCPRFVGLVARVEMGASPDWMQRRLVLAGMRPISNVVDVTNYVMLERCRPLHAFDLDRLGGRGIVVRLANDGEKMTTLDDVERKLTRDDLLICDAERTPQSHRRHHGRGRRRSVGRDHDDPARVGVLRSVGNREELQASRAAIGSERPFRTRRRPQRLRVGRGACVASSSNKWRKRSRLAAPSTCTRSRSNRRASLCGTTRVNQLLGTDLSDGEIADYLTPLGIDAPRRNRGRTDMATRSRA